MDNFKQEHLTIAVITLTVFIAVVVVIFIRKRRQREENRISDNKLKMYSLISKHSDRAR